jgi:hypothetical protein
VEFTALSQYFPVIAFAFNQSGMMTSCPAGESEIVLIVVGPAMMIVNITSF